MRRLRWKHDVSFMRNPMFILYVLMFIAVVALIIQVRTTRISNEHNRSLGRQNNAILHIIVDCTDPSGECAKQGSKNQLAVIGALNKVTVASEACGKQYSTEDDILKCVVATVGPQPGLTVAPTATATPTP